MSGSRSQSIIDAIKSSLSVFAGIGRSVDESVQTANYSGMEVAIRKVPNEIQIKIDEIIAQIGDDLELRVSILRMLIDGIEDQGLKMELIKILLTDVQNSVVRNLSIKAVAAGTEPELVKLESDEVNASLTHIEQCAMDFIKRTDDEELELAKALSMTCVDESQKGNDKVKDEPNEIEQLEIAKALSLADESDKDKKDNDKDSDTDIEKVFGASKNAIEKMIVENVTKAFENLLPKILSSDKLVNLFKEGKSKLNLEDISKSDKEKLQQFKRRVAQRIYRTMSQEINQFALREIEILIEFYENAQKHFEANENVDKKKIVTKHDAESIKKDRHLNDVATLALKSFVILNQQHQSLLSFVNFFKPAIDEFKLALKDKPTFVIQDEDKPKSLSDSTAAFFHKSFLALFCPVVIPGDGNCLWSSVSYNLFGDRSYSEALRLLTGATFIDMKDQFRAVIAVSQDPIIKDQQSKFGYKPLSFEDLLTAALSPGLWGDEFHILALSAALRRPIYSYGSFSTILKHVDKDASFAEIKKYCENNDIANHFRYVAYEADEDKEPICLFYDGALHYSPIVQLIIDESWYRNPIKPKTRLLDYLVKAKQETL